MMRAGVGNVASPLYRPTIAVIGDSLTEFGQQYPRTITATEPDWLRFLGGLKYNMAAGAAQLEFRVSDQAARWTAPGDTAGPWTVLRAGYNFLESATANNTVVLGIRTDFYPVVDTTVSCTVVAANRANLSNGYWVAAQALTGHKLELLSCLGIGGDRSRHVLARIDQIFSINELNETLSAAPGYVMLCIGTNDVVADSMTAAQVTPTIDAIVSRILQRGARPILCTIPARDGQAIGKMTELFKVNEHIRNAAVADGRIILVDLFAVTRDPADSDGSAITGYLADSTHDSNLGAFIKGREILRVLLPYIGNVIGRARSLFAGDPYNLCTNNSLSGTTGTSSNPPGGAPTQVVGTGWRVQRSTGTTATASAIKVSETGELDWQEITCASATAGDVIQLTRTSAMSLATLGLSAGESIYAEVEFQVVSATALRRVDLQMFIAGTTNKTVSANAFVGSASSNADLPAGVSYSGVLRVPVAEIQSGGSTVNLNMQAVFGTSGAATIKFRAPGLFRA